MIIFIFILFVIKINTTKITNDKSSISNSKFKTLNEKSSIFLNNNININKNNLILSKIKTNLLNTQNTQNTQNTNTLIKNNVNKNNVNKNNENNNDIQNKNNVNNNDTIFPYTYGNFTIINFNVTNKYYEIKNNLLRRYIYFNIAKPIDNFQYAKNISCTSNNCKYPNICLNKNICLCNDVYANFFYNNNNNNDLIYCSYNRISPVLISFLEFIFPGLGMIIIGNYAYGIIKFLIGIIFLVLVIIRIINYFKDKNEDNDNYMENLNLNLNKEQEDIRKIFINKSKDEKDNNIDYINNDNNDITKSLIKNDSFNDNTFINNNTSNNNNNSYLNLNKSRNSKKKDNSLSTSFSSLDLAIIRIGIIILIWLMIDFSLIGMRMFVDKNGVGFINYPNYGNMY